MVGKIVRENVSFGHEFDTRGVGRGDTHKWPRSTHPTFPNKLFSGRKKKCQPELCAPFWHQGKEGLGGWRGERKFHSNQLLRSWNRGNGGEGRSVRNFFPGGMTAGITPPWHAALESGKKKVERNFRSSPRSQTRLQSRYITEHAWTCTKAFLWSHWKSKDPPST